LVLVLLGISLTHFLLPPVVTVRDAKHTNFVEFRNFKIVYRRYAGLYFCICVDVADNNLYYLEVRPIHQLTLLRTGHPQLCGGSQRILPQCLRARSGVQLLQGGSQEVLGVTIHGHQVYTVVDEMFLAGEIRETSQTKVCGWIHF